MKSRRPWNLIFVSFHFSAFWQPTFRKTFSLALTFISGSRPLFSPDSGFCSSPAPEKKVVETAKNLSARHWPQSSPIVKSFVSRKLIFPVGGAWIRRSRDLVLRPLAQAAKVRHFIHFPFGSDESNTFHPPFSFTLSRMPLTDVKKAKAISTRFTPSGTEKKLLHDSMIAKSVISAAFYARTN